MVGNPKKEGVMNGYEGENTGRSVVKRYILGPLDSFMSHSVCNTVFLEVSRLAKGFVGLLFIGPNSRFDILIHFWQW